VHEILQGLAPGQRVLDLGSGAGSFDASTAPFIAIRADLDRPQNAAANFVQTDAAHLPFPERAFDAVISNHSLEHFHDPFSALAEIGRVLKPSGGLYVAVPDASTFCDRLYRWLARGGGHVNPFTSAAELAAQIERATGLPHVATRTLFTSLSYLNRRNRRVPAPKRLLLLGGGTEMSLHLFTYFSRLSDRFSRHAPQRLWLGTLFRIFPRSHRNRSLVERLRPLWVRRALGVTDDSAPGLSQNLCLPELRNHEPVLRRSPLPALE
jgi:SAM-dependent methyltransferase